MTDWTNDRLDQLAFAVEANAAAIAELRAVVVDTRGSCQFSFRDYYASSAEF